MSHAQRSLISAVLLLRRLLKCESQDHFPSGIKNGRGSLNFFLSWHKSIWQLPKEFWGPENSQVHKPSEQGIASGWCLNSALLKQTVSCLIESVPEPFSLPLTPPCRNQPSTGRDHGQKVLLHQGREMSWESSLAGVQVFPAVFPASQNALFRTLTPHCSRKGSQGYF